MLHKRILLLVSVASILFTSCDFTPSVINETDCKVFALCAVAPTFVGNELYDYTIQKYKQSISDGNEDELGDLVFEEGDDMWNIELVTDHQKYYSGEIYYTGGDFSDEQAARAGDFIHFLSLKDA